MTEHLRGHDAAEGLTPIGARIHSAATPLEVQQLQIATFLDALADMALSVARRIAESGEGDGA